MIVESCVNVQHRTNSRNRIYFTISLVLKSITINLLSSPPYAISCSFGHIDSVFMHIESELFTSM